MEKMKHAVVLAAAFALSGFLMGPPDLVAQQDATRLAPQDVGAQPGHLPKVHYLRDYEYPVWVDSSMVFKPNGSVNTAYLSPDGAETLRALQAKAPAHGCEAVGASYVDILNPPERSSIEEATRNSRLVILGKVTEKAYGISDIMPGQLLLVVSEEVIKGQPRNVPAYFVFMPVGHFELGGVDICKSDSRYPEPPKIGEEVLLFVPPLPNVDQKEPFLELLDDAGIVTLRSDSTVSLPKRFTIRNPGPAKTSTDLLDRVHKAAGEEGN
jgi:hypothetical protein